MMQFGPDFDFAKEVSEKWNKKRKSLRILSIVLAALMVLLGILFIAFPQQSLVVIERIASVVILILGVYLLVDYFQTEVFLRRPGVLIDSILNILMGLLLLFSPATITIAAFAFLFGIQMLIYGISQLVMAQQIGCFAVSGYGWMI
ncbi:MAG: DUF308 domain-containing protein [Oscillospiraceae bacterium]|nr:DUF308 domain-containing protein [Oscillospiraceae bacterium]